MRTNDERIAAMHRRASELMQERKQKKMRLAGAVSGALGILIILLLAAALSAGSALSAPQMAGIGMSGSIFSANGSLGYIVIGIVAFMLGVSVTVFSFRLKDWREGRDESGKKDTDNP